jgi:hypothetical protein
MPVLTKGKASLAAIKVISCNARHEQSLSLKSHIKAKHGWITVLDFLCILDMTTYGCSYGNEDPVMFGLKRNKQKLTQVTMVHEDSFTHSPKGVL